MSTPARGKITMEVLVRVRWLAVLSVLLSLYAVVWVLINIEAWPECLVMVGAAVALAVLSGEQR